MAYQIIVKIELNIIQNKVIIDFIGMPNNKYNSNNQLHTLIFNSSIKNKLINNYI